MAIDLSIVNSPFKKLRYKTGFYTDIYSIMLLNSNEFIFTTTYGIYKYIDNEKTFYQYHPEYAKPLMNLKGDFEVDHSGCWLVTPDIDRIVFQKEIK